MAVFHDYYKFRNNVYKLGSDTKLSHFPKIRIWLGCIVLLTLASPILANINLIAGIACLIVLAVVFTCFIFYTNKVSKSSEHEQKLVDLEDNHLKSVRETFDEIFYSKEEKKYNIDQTKASFLIELVKSDIDEITTKANENASSAYSSTIVSTALSVFVNLVIYTSFGSDANTEFQLISSVIALVVLFLMLVFSSNIKQTLRYKQLTQLSNLRYMQYFLETMKITIEEQSSNSNKEITSLNPNGSNMQNSSEVNVDTNITSPSSMNTSTRVNSNPNVFVNTNVDCNSGIHVATNVDSIPNMKVAVNVNIFPGSEIAPCISDNAESNVLPDSDEIPDEKTDENPEVCNNETTSEISSSEEVQKSESETDSKE